MTTDCLKPDGDTQLLCCDFRTSLELTDHVDWNAIFRFLSVQQPCFNDATGRHFLRTVLAKNPPAPVVMETLRVYPDALACNVSAYFAACKFSSPEVLRSMFLSDLSRSRTATCPYPWIVFSHVSVDGTATLLEACPHGVLVVSPSLRFGCCPLDYMIFGIESYEQNEWDKLMLMLLAAEHVTWGVEQGPHPVHTLLWRAISQQDILHDPNKLKRVGWLLRQLFLIDPGAFRTRLKNGDMPLHVLLQRECQESHACIPLIRDIIGILVHASPESPKIPRKGRLPLHTAMENGWPCHDILVSFAPEGLQTQDGKTGLYPFQTAACSKNFARECNSGSISSLDVCYELLLENPLQAIGLEAHP